MTDSDRRHHRLFYGWWIVIVCTLVTAFTTGAIAHSFTTIFEPIREDFGWTYAQVSLAASIRGFEGGFLSPIAGLLFNRLGARKIMFSGIAITGISLLLLSRVNSLWTFYGAIFLVASSMSLTVGVVPIATVGNWFKKKVTLVTGIVLCGTAIGGLMIPIVTKLIDTYGWRTAMVINGLSALIIFLPLTLVIRQKPEQYGYLPDGDTSELTASSEINQPPSSTDTDISSKDALKSRAFWQLVLGMVCFFMFASSVTTHVMPYLGTIGFSRSTASLVATAIPLTSILGRLGFGWLGDRVNKRLLLIACCILYGTSVLFFSMLNTAGAWLVLPFILFFGIGWGSSVVMPAALLREYFGRMSLGTLLGLAIGMGHFSTLVGPLVTGWIFDHYGSYYYAWIGLVGLACIATILFITFPSASKIKAHK